MTALPWAATHLDRRPASIIEVATDSIGLYVAPPVSHLELAARVPGYGTADVEVLLADRLLIGLRCLRGSAFLMPVDVLAVVVPATRDKNVRAFGAYIDRSLSTAPYEEWVDRILDVLPPGESLTKREITARLDPPEADRPFMTNVISQMATESRLVGVRAPVSWRSAQIAYTRWEDWLPDVDVESPDPEMARVELARLYLSSFGPATVDDFAWWSGLTKTQARAAIGATEAVGEAGWFSLGDGGGEPPRGVRLLPIWDTLFVTWKDRSRFIPEALLPYIYDTMGNATSVVLLDGVVAGVWAMGPDADPFQVRVAPFDEFSRAQWAAVEDEAQVVATLAGSGSADIVRVPEAPDLRAGKRNLFMHPV